MGYLLARQIPVSRTRLQMADYSEKCGEDCSFDDYSDDKHKGVCLIKEEFIIEDRIRLQNEECLVGTNKRSAEESIKARDEETTSHELSPKRFKSDDKKEKLRGQNKARPPPFKTLRETNLCPWIADQVEGEVEKKCENKRCSFLHDRKEYLQIKPSDINEDCYLFDLMGRCPRGAACRMGSKHLTEDGFNIIDANKLQEYKRKPSSTQNQLSKLLQNKLRKHKYNFSKAETIVKGNNPSAKKISTKSRTLSDTEEIDKDLHLEDVLVEEGAKNDEREEPRVGPVEDYDLIKIRPSEKKKIDWKNKVMLSPLTTVGNLPFRRICKGYGADITCGEMALAPKILKGAHEEWALVKRHKSEDIFGIQLCGNNPGVLTRCAQLLNEEIDIDFIDLNLGCPIDLIYRQGGGSGMLNRLNVLETVIKSVSQVVEIPLSVKTRTGVYIDKPIAHNLMPKFRDWGVSMITVHGRSREQRYTKLADWNYIEKCAQAAKPVPVFGNGDILSFDDYQRALNVCTSVEGVTIGRGALIKPWIFTEMKEKKLIDVRSTERFDILKKYANYGLEHWGSDTRGVETTRRFMLEWISFLHRYVPVGLLERPPQRINERPPFYKGRDEMETLMASSNCADWVKISEMLLGKVPDGFHFLPKHKANSWK
ncbi:tRNA-dihydrouridine(47) synthase [NAD(P)(+)]-like isoform X2 [Vespa mandarinia]|uniref:tRNA-dihydrouridine(47) synthase [NAD(P)(+)]-like isoform X2 n=1 Tax=Vespa mandarinia TaxID=7446 RepID=UPI00161A89A0|nr:tRNA-dihydrouridine(47) synthase [NAD(P)(+)]-like isoform X2 [Vespa mandarinia]